MTTPNDDQIRDMLEARAGQPDGANPDDILDQVIRSSRPARSVSIWPRLFGGLAAAALVVIVAGLFLTRQAGGPGATGSTGVGAGTGSSEPSSAPSGEPSSGPSVAPTATPTPTVAPATPVPTLAANRPCLTSQLSARIVSWQGAAGNRIADVRVTNEGPVKCILAGNPRVQLRGSDGAVLIDSSTNGGAPSSSGTGAIDVPSVGAVTTEVDASNYCGPAPALPITVAFILPAGAGTVVAKPAPGTDDAFAVPPCNGSAPAVISTNGWVAGH
ncbi:MAG: DUF4232 domain-containing protein [Candidatus Limnocylindrales bacterium]